MLFNSVQFLLFFPVVVAAYFLTPVRARWLLLLLASYFFYMSWRPEYGALIAFTTIVNYIAALRISRTDDRRVRLGWLWASIGASLGVLLLFKYSGFFTASVNDGLGLLGVSGSIPVLQLLLPVGISFYTFQTMSYTIDVYNGEAEPEPHFGKLALYVSYFPQLVAGPIERSQRLLPQLPGARYFDPDRARDGVALMIWGFFKKLVIADRLAPLVEAVYSDPSAHAGPTLLIATVLFALQIYCDFSGYSDIAIGAAQVMGVDLMANFRQPYHARSIGEFWRRWHISLSTWFRDYVYIPLGGNRTVRWRWYYNLLVTFLVSGLWHGANWTFIVWGGLHGLFLVAGVATAAGRGTLVRRSGLADRPRLHDACRLAITFALTCFAWIFFRAESVTDALRIIRRIASDWSLLLSPTHLAQVPDALGAGPSQLWVAAAAVLVLEAGHQLQRRGSVRQMLAECPSAVRWSVYNVGILAILFYGELGGADFVYFQF